MTNIRLITLIAIALALINILLLGYIILRKPGGRHPDGPRNTIIEKLRFDTGQIAAYDSLITNHRSQVNRNEKTMYSLKSRLYASLHSNEKTIIKDSLIREIGLIQIQLEETHINHFEALKGLCKGDQKTAFDSLTLTLANLFSQRPTPHKK